jgi:hypothetical protein
MNPLQALLFLVGLAAADISLQPFTSTDCGGTVINDIHSNAANPQDGSGCIATNQYQSVQAVSVDPGFQCNVYSDNACQDFLQSITAVGCTNVIGTGVICFSQALFDNAFAQSTATVTIGQSIVVSDTGGGPLMNAAINSGCESSTGCDPTSPFSQPWEHLNKDCSFTVTMTGSYANTNERDYMKGLIAQALTSGTTDTRQDLTGSAEDNDTIFNLPSFVQVVVTGPDSSIQAQMTATLAVECNPASDGDCQSLLGTITNAVLGAVPDVGGILAGAFSVACQVETS